MAISSKHGVKRPKVVEESESSDFDDNQPEDDFEVEIKREEDDYLDSSNLEGDSFMAYPNDEDSVEIKEEDLYDVDIKEEVVENWEAEGSAEETLTKDTKRKRAKKVKFSEPKLDSDSSEFSENDNEEDNFADDDSEKDEGEVKKSVGSGLANVMAKILGTKKSEDVILSKAKTDKEVRKTLKLAIEDTFEVVDGSGQVKKEPMAEIKDEGEDRKPDISLHDREIHPVVEILPPGEASQEGGGTLPNPVVPSLSPDPDSVPGLQQARANSAKARNEHRAALLEEIRDQGTSFKEMVSSALASTHVKEDPPALQYWKEVLNPIANDCVAIGERYRSDLLAEIAALITRWKRLAATGVEAAPPEFMVNMIASVGGARQPPTAPPIQQPAMEAVPLGAMGMVPGATPMLHIPSDTNVFRPQQQVVQQPKVLHRPLSSSTPYETNNTSLQSFGIPASFVVDNLPSFSVNTPTPQSAPPTTLHTTSNTVNTPKK